MMKQYEMMVETLDHDGNVLVKWSGSKLFEAESASDALHDAVWSEYEQLMAIPYHRDVFNTTFANAETFGVEPFGCVYWTNPAGQRLSERITVREYERE